ncbi:MAG: ABC transporter permease [Acidiferrobacterales bacterium]
MLDLSLPRLKRRSVSVWRRNILVWRKLMGPSLMLNFGEPLVYLLGLGYGLGLFIGKMAGVDYLTFLASGIIASSAMTTATFEGMYSVYTRMVPQRTYDAMLATPTEVDDILAGEMFWCATKSLINGIAILAVAAILGAVADMRAVLVLPVVFLIGLCFAGPAMVMTSISKGYDFFAYYFTLVITPMFIVCGVFYPTNVLPEFVQRFVQVLPLTHAVALTRPLIIGQPLTDVALHISVLLAYAVIGYYIAVILTRRRLVV